MAYTLEQKGVSINSSKYIFTTDCRTHTCVYHKGIYLCRQAHNRADEKDRTFLFAHEFARAIFSRFEYKQKKTTNNSSDSHYDKCLPSAVIKINMMAIPPRFLTQ